MIITNYVPFCFQAMETDQSLVRQTRKHLRMWAIQWAMHTSISISSTIGMQLSSFVFDIAFMFLAFGGVIAIQDAGGDIDIWSAMITLTVFIVLMSLGVWHVFRKRGRIYI